MIYEKEKKGECNLSPLEIIKPLECPALAGRVSCCPPAKSQRNSSTWNRSFIQLLHKGTSEGKTFDYFQNLSKHKHLNPNFTLRNNSTQSTRLGFSVSQPEVGTGDTYRLNRCISTRNPCYWLRSVQNTIFKLR